jgi:hypothetical protein
VSNHEVRHVWSCENCGREMQMAVNPCIAATSEPKKRQDSLVAA